VVERMCFNISVQIFIGSLKQVSYSFCPCADHHANQGQGT
jgi:hypothetical protein